MNRTIVDNQEDIIQEKLKNILGDGDGPSENCPTRTILDRFSDKWSILSIFHLGAAGVLRFNELKKRINGVSQRMLTVTLRSLERDGLITRRVYPEIPPRVEYELTDLGYSLLVQVIELGQWANDHSQQIRQSRARYDAREPKILEAVPMD
ncbi:helix-turn-helix transcriptional regulator [Spirosoma sp. BT702]|uniref:Helix-turn-helix transcriptional regulator n=1 Tax=Spirosoma profusum TaxID=2771354 RepID=A0A927API2_9BACT|nr:helix-turn-helix domain-containing protein [Spirosoma profusum]MBD2704654.1 helix-turn-helix transcriptional regulator [Spirosoma profusum]